MREIKRSEIWDLINEMEKESKTVSDQDSIELSDKMFNHGTSYGMQYAIRRLIEILDKENDNDQN